MAKRDDSFWRHPLVSTVVGGLILAAVLACFKSIRDAKIWHALWSIARHPIPLWSVGLLLLIGFGLGVWMGTPAKTRPALNIFWHEHACWWAPIKDQPNHLILYGEGIFSLINFPFNIALVRGHFQGTRELEAFPEQIYVESGAPEKKTFFVILSGLNNLRITPSKVIQSNFIFVDHAGQEHSVPVNFRLKLKDN